MSLVWAVEQRRGGVVEAEHRVHACALELVGDTQGRLLFQVGSDLHTTFRSAAKPFQLESVIALLPAALATALTPTELALGSASHHGEREHIDALERLLHTLAREREHLYCGAHEPVAVESTRALRARGQAPDVLHTTVRASTRSWRPPAPHRATPPTTGRRSTRCSERSGATSSSAWDTR